MRYDLAIFDIDGTLADSFPFFVSVQNRLADKHGFRRIEPGELEALRRLSARELMRHAGLSRWKLPFVARSYVKLMRDEGHAVTRFGAVDAALATLAERGIALAVVSSNSAENCRRVLGEDNWRRLVHVECGASIFGKRRRLARVVKRAGVAAQRAIYVADQTTDAEAARAAGLAFAAVGWGYAALPSLVALRPEVVIERVEDLAVRLLEDDSAPSGLSPLPQ